MNLNTDFDEDVFSYRESEKTNLNQTLGYIVYACIIHISLHLLYMNPPNPSQIATLPGAFSKSWQWPKAIKSIDLASDVATHNAVLSSCSQSSSWSQVGVDVFVKDIGDYNPKKPIHDNTTKL